MLVVAHFFFRFPVLKAASENPHTLLLYPSADAIDLNELLLTSDLQQPHTLLMLDGTWPQAKGIYKKNSWLRDVRQVRDGASVLYMNVMHCKQHMCVHVLCCM